MTFDELYKKVIDAQMAFEERHIPISLDFKIEDLRDALVESNDTIEKLKQKLQDQCTSCPVKMQEDDVVAEFKQKLESVQASMYCDVVDAGMENRRLKRALWLAREQTAIEKHNHFALCHNNSTDLYLCINGASIPTESSTTMRLSSEWSMIWKRVVAKCRAKAEEYQ